MPLGYNERWPASFGDGWCGSIDTIGHLRVSNFAARTNIKSTEAGKLAELSDDERRLLRELIENSRQTQKVIGGRLGFSPKKMSETIAALQARGVIKKFTTQIDYSKIGYPILGFFLFSLNDKSSATLQQLRDTIISDPRIIESFELFGKEQDYIIKIMCQDNSELRGICELITDLEYVRKDNCFTYAVARIDKATQGVSV